MAVRLPRHESNMLRHTAQRVVRWMKTVEREPCQSFSGSAARRPAASVKSWSALKLIATSNRECESLAATAGMP